MLKTCLTLFAIGAAVRLGGLDARRIRVRPQDQNGEEAIGYYETDDPQQEQRVVYISSADQYNGLYGQPSSASRTVTRNNYIPRGPPPSPVINSHRDVAAAAAAAAVVSKTKDKTTAPVQTIRNYNKVNDDGSFTFGYEAADGSFKEETRGTDCVVRGKYGYVDPDGNKREFTYVSGNPCDPNAPKEEEEEEEEKGKPEEETNESDDYPANYPTRPITPLIRRPVTSTPKPAVTLFQNNYHYQGVDEDEQQQQQQQQQEPEQVLKQSVRHRPPQYIARPQYLQVEDSEEEPVLYQRKSIASSIINPSTSTPASTTIYKQTETPLTITPRPFTIPTVRPKLTATTYRPSLLQVAVVTPPRPTPLVYTKQVQLQTRPPHIYASSATASTPLSITRGGGGGLDFNAEFHKFQTEHNIVSSPTPKTLSKSDANAKSPSLKSNDNVALTGGAQVYSSELVFDPSTGQYNTQLYQTLPQSGGGDFSLSQRIQPYVQQPQAQLLNLKQLQQQSPLYRQQQQQQQQQQQDQQHPQVNQALYQQQQAELQFQNSAQLYAQQQRARQQQQQQQQQQSSQQVTASPAQPFYYIQPSSVRQPQALQGGQIDAFLRGHNIQF